MAVVKSAVLTNCLSEHRWHRNDIPFTPADQTKNTHIEAKDTKPFIVFRPEFTNSWLPKNTSDEETKWNSFGLQYELLRKSSGADSGPQAVLWKY